MSSSSLSPSPAGRAIALELPGGLRRALKRNSSVIDFLHGIVTETCFGTTRFSFEHCIRMNVSPWLRLSKVLRFLSSPHESALSWNQERTRILTFSYGGRPVSAKSMHLLTIDASLSCRTPSLISLSFLSHFEIENGPPRGLCRPRFTDAPHLERSFIILFV